MNVRIVITGDRATRKKLQKLGRSIYRLRPAMKNIGEDLSSYYEKVPFGSQGKVYGKKWQKLSPAYAAKKDKRYTGKGLTPLIASGTMQDSFYYKAKKSSVYVSNSAEYFKYHQSTKPRKRIPRRQMIGTNPEVRRIIRGHIQDEINKKLRKA